MPYKITGRIIADDGYPIPNDFVMIKELPVSGVPYSPGSVVADENGYFTFMATSENSKIEVSCHFFTAQTFTAKNFPSVVQLSGGEGAVINGQVTKPKADNNNWLWYAAAAAAVIAIIASGKKKTGKGLKSPAQAKRVIPTVTV